MKAIEAAGGKAAFLQSTFTSRESVESLLAESLKKFGRVDGLIKRCGRQRRQRLLRDQGRDWQKVLNINLTGVHLGTQVFGKHMSGHGGGSIVNLG